MSHWYISDDEDEVINVRDASSSEEDERLVKSQAAQQTKAGKKKASKLPGAKSDSRRLTAVPPTPSNTQRLQPGSSHSFTMLRVDSLSKPAFKKKKNKALLSDGEESDFDEEAERRKEMAAAKKKRDRKRELNLKKA